MRKQSGVSLDEFIDAEHDWIRLLNAILDKDNRYLKLLLEVRQTRLLDLLEGVRRLLWREARNRRFMWTRDGMAGKAMPATQPGDLVCNLVGDEVPYV